MAAIPEAMAGGRLTIDLAALAANWRRFADLAAPAECAAVVKADAYGLGAERVVPALAVAGCRSFFVVQVSEAVVVAPLLPAGARLFVLNGLYAGTEATFRETGALPVLNSLHQARLWQDCAARTGERLPAAVQIDTGMTRLGMPIAEAEALAGDAVFAGHVETVLVMSHLANADEAGDPANERQRQAFAAAAALFPGVPRSLANSGGTVLGGGFLGDLVRPGIALYGGNPTDDPDFALAPVVGLDARVIQLRDVPAGTGVGYGLTYTTTRPTRIATLGLGYADGWLRSLSGRGSAFFGGVRLPIIGRVSMDSMTIDVTDIGEGAPQEGDWVELIGPHQSLDDVARDAGTIAYEVLTSIGRRYHVRTIGGAA